MIQAGGGEVDGNDAKCGRAVRRDQAPAARHARRDGADRAGAGHGLSDAGRGHAGHVRRRRGRPRGCSRARRPGHGRRSLLGAGQHHGGGAPVSDRGDGRRGRPGRRPARGAARPQAARGRRHDPARTLRGGSPGRRRARGVQDRHALREVAPPRKAGRRSVASSAAARGWSASSTTRRARSRPTSCVPSPTGWTTCFSAARSRPSAGCCAGARRCEGWSPSRYGAGSTSAGRARPRSKASTPKSGAAASS